MTVAVRIRTYGSMVAFAHTVFALPFAASAVVLSLAQPHVPSAVAPGRDARLHGVRAHQRDGVQPLGRSRHRRPQSRTRTRHVPSGAVRAGEALALAVVSGLAFLAVAATLGFWPGVLAPPSSSCCSATPTQALHVGRARVARVALALAPGARGSPWGRAWPRHRAAHGRRGELAPRVRHPLLAPGRGLRPRRRPPLDPGPLRYPSRPRHQRVFARRDGACARGCGLALHRGPAYAVAVTIAAALLVYEHALVRRRGLGAIDRAFFDVNAWVSVAFFAFVLTDEVLRRFLAA